ncbi:putative drug exporter of the RND superfamily [Jiangella alkaliphila]|uniref:Putative drug exporter of the RND superfamily n=2 Tax=Jiangella alkaliphila TaxID=419479 RepID=A0A1H2LXT3_9ACTN|nr:MMPL family transporter [Jiangella alkaliphila]SDU85694.1 putative drug exporter of the RND superfamily [Jiangella alkaliphila]
MNESTTNDGQRPATPPGSGAPEGSGADQPDTAEWRDGPAGGGAPRPPADPPRPGVLGRLAGASYRRRGRVVAAWVVAIAAAFGLSAAFAGDFTADYSAPGSDSRQAQDLLEERFPAQSGDTIDVVVRTDGAAVTDPAVQADVTALLDQLRTQPHVVAVDDPYETAGGISQDGDILVATVNLDVVLPDDMPVEETEELLAMADAAERPGLEIALGGQTVALAEQGEIGSEAIGMAAAAVILLITFGTVVAAGLPLIVAIAGLALSGMLTGLVAAVVDVPDWSTALATMMGIALGIDYVLLMVTRFREWRAAGLDPERATIATLDTAGRAVMVAGSTVMVSMLGLFAMGLTFMQGASLVTIVAVVVVMAAAATLFPALLGFFGRWVDRLRLPLGRRRQATAQLAAGGHVEPSRAWMRWGRLVDRHSIIATVVGVGLLLALAAPFLGVRFGFPDAGNNAEDRSARQAYDLLSEGFGAGANGPLLLVADLDDPTDADGLPALSEAVAATPGVAAVMPTVVNEAGDAGLLTVLPTTGPQDAATEDLVHTLRDDVIPGTGVEVHVGGVTATSIDSTENTAERLPLLIGGVVILSMILLLVSFRSIVIPITAALMNLLSVAAAYGVVALVLEGGWAGQLIGIDTETPMPAFIPVLVFAVLFGLSMDYEVFLISRMREAWMRTGDNARAIVEGLAGTGRVITAAAAIMVAVFAAFIPSPEVFLKVIGVGMAAAILVDATVVRMLLVPAVMHLLGRSNWWLPSWLERRLPQLHVEGRPEVYLPDGEPADQRELAPAR